MAKKVSSERFLIHVSTKIERQLQEWDATYQVCLMKLKDYQLMIRYGTEHKYSLTIKETELKDYQKEAPYALDRYIWGKLLEQGLKVNVSSGNYLELVLKDNNSNS